MSNNTHPVLAKLRERIAQKNANPQLAEMSKKIKQYIEARAAEQAAQEAKEGGE